MESAWFYQAVKYTPEGVRIEKTEALPCVASVFIHL